MGAGKEETYIDLQASAIFDSGDNLYSKELVRLYGIYKKIDPVTFTKDMINASRKYFSPELFEALGVGVKNKAAVTVVSDAAMYAHINSKYGYDNTVLFYYSSAQADGTPIKSDPFKIEKYLSENYTVDQSFSRTFIDTISMRVKAISANQCPTDGLKVWQDYFGYSSPDTIDIATDTYAYEINPGEWYSVKDGIIGTEELTGKWVITMVLLDDNWQETTTEIIVNIPEDFRTLNISRYAYTSDCSGWQLKDPFLYYKADIIGEAYTYRFFIFPIKDDGQFVETPAYQDVLLNDFGLGNGALEESLADSRIEKALITYSVEFDYSPFLPYFKNVYGTNGNRNEVVFYTPHYNIRYYDQYNADNSSGTYMINMDGHTFTAQGRNVAMVPVDIMNDFTMPEMYTFLRDMLRIWGNTSETVKFKWYQTGFFKFLMLVVTVAIAAFTGQWELVGLAVGLQIGMKVFGEVLPPELMAIVAIAAAIYTLDFSSIGNGFATLANLTNNVSQVYFIQNQQDMLKQIETTKEMAKAEAEVLKEMQNEILYIPIDSYSSYFTTMYDTLYNSYDGMYDSMFNFDRMLKPTMRIKA